MTYGTDLNRADNWGTLHLAADVKDDGGRAFKGPAWVEDIFKGLVYVPASRLRVIDSAMMPGASGPAVKVTAEYGYLDPHGNSKTGKAKLYLPAAAKDGKAKIPLYYSAGYELDDGSAMQHVRKGFAVVTPSGLEANPLSSNDQPRSGSVAHCPVVALCGRRQDPDLRR